MLCACVDLPVHLVDSTSVQLPAFRVMLHFHTAKLAQSFDCVKNTRPKTTRSDRNQ
jgi:hypothetical protein